jgi:hypothetical protein
MPGGGWVRFEQRNWDFKKEDRLKDRHEIIKRILTTATRNTPEQN